MATVATAGPPTVLSLSSPRCHRRSHNNRYHSNSSSYSNNSAAATATTAEKCAQLRTCICLLTPLAATATAVCGRCIRIDTDTHTHQSANNRRMSALQLHFMSMLVLVCGKCGCFSYLWLHSARCYLWVWQVQGALCGRMTSGIFLSFCK